MRESKKVVGDDAIMVNPTMLASWGIESPLKESEFFYKKYLKVA